MAGRDQAGTIPFECDHSATARLVLRWPPSSTTRAGFDAAWRDQEAWTEGKYAMWDVGKKLGPPSYGPGKPAHTFRRCPFGEVFDMHVPEEVSMHVPHITAAEAVQAQ